MESLQGQLLIATPRLLDPNFLRTVILLVQHDENGALGLVLNRPTKTSIGDAWQQVSETPYHNQAPLFQGGPCEGPLLALHSEETVSQIKVCKGVHFSTEAPHVTWLVEHHADPIRFFVGYAGWGPGQLEAEMAEHSWLTAPATADQVFTPPRDQWLLLARALARTLSYPDLDPKLIPPDPSYN